MTTFQYEITSAAAGEILDLLDKTSTVNTHRVNIAALIQAGMLTVELMITDLGREELAEYRERKAADLYSQTFTA